MLGWSRWLVLGLALVMGACATVDKEAVRTQTQGKSLVVASGLNSQLDLKWIGLTVFNNEIQTVEAADWALPAQFHQALQRQLEATGRFSGVTVVHQPGADRSALLTAAGQDADVALLLTPGSAGDPIYMTNQYIRGFGVFQRSALGILLNSLPHVVVKGELVDLKTAQPLGDTLTQTFEIKEHSLIKGPVISEEKRPMVRESLTKQMDPAAAQMLKNFGIE
jgi:hypothetical protein